MLLQLVLFTLRTFLFNSFVQFVAVKVYILETSFYRRLQNRKKVLRLPQIFVFFCLFFHKFFQTFFNVKITTLFYLEALPTNTDEMRLSC